MAKQAVTLPPGFIEEPVGGTWTQVVGMTFSADGRLFVWEKAGRIWLVQDGVRSAAPVLDISEEVGDWRDFGMLGVALHPNFAANGYIYLLYVVDFHHLTKFGTPEYDSNADLYLHDTIGRIARYTVTQTDGALSVDPATRKVLLGETIQSGVPIHHTSHGTGTILFGKDGSLLASTGDGASYSVMDVGGNISGSSNTALADGIITPKEDVGAFRSQLVDSLSGKVLRLDPMTGDGVPSNPFYNAAAPRSARSRTWALGLRNPFRMTLRPETGSHNIDDGKPGTLYVGDVGWNTLEELNVVTGPAMNFGWPIYEGLTAHPDYSTQNVSNLDAANPLLGGSCTRTHFDFRELLVQDSTRAPSFPNPCNTGVQIPASIPRFEHVRPVLDWRHGQTQTRAPGYDASGNATAVRLSTAGAPVSGPEFPGNCSVAGAWYTGTEFPPEYRNTYFHADYGARWIRNFVFDQNDRLTTVRNFVPNDSANLVAIAAHPADGSLYYVDYQSTLRRIRYVGGGNRPPRIVAEADAQYGGSPHRVRFTGSGSSDPEMGPLTYSWNFGDGSPPSSEADPEHVFVTGGPAPTRFDVTLTVTDVAGARADAQLIISVNNTPPDVQITSPVADGVFSQSANSQITLSATVSDAEHSPSEITCEWTTTLHHNEHSHPEATVQGCTATALVSPVSCYEETYYFGFTVKVTDGAGLTTTKDARLFPDCTPRPLSPKGPGHPLRPTYRWTPVVGADGYGLVVDDSVATGKVDMFIAAADAGCANGEGECVFTPSISLAAGAASFRVRARNGVDGLRALSPPLAFEVVNAAPTPVIALPAPGQTFGAGEAVTFAGSATDAEDGALPASVLRWTLGTGQTFQGVSGGSFTAPSTPVPANLTVSLTAFDSAGTPGATVVTLTPRVVPLSFTSVPPGLSLVVNGEAQATPFTRNVVEGATLTVAAASQTQGALTYDFVSWSDGGAAQHDVIAGAAQSFVATFDDVNAAPTAKAGPDASVGSGALVTLDGSTSSDPNGDSLSYAWTQIGGPAVTLSSSTASRPTFTAPQVSSATALTFSLVVQDAALGSTADTVVITVAPIPSGLSAIYYNNADFTGTTVTRVDAGVNFNWGTAAPVSGISGDTFSVRWSGRILPRFTETYTFTTSSDAGIRLWLNGRLVIDAWAAHTTRDDSGTIALVANQPYDIRIEYFENTGTAVARLRWASASQAAEYVPASRLGTVAVPTSEQPPIAEAGPNQTVSSAATVTLDASGSLDPNGEPLTYAWLQTSGTQVLLSSATAQRPTFAAPEVTLATTLVFSLTVADPRTTSAPDTVTVVVQPPVGTGLKAEYFDNMDLTGTRIQRLDARVDFSWGSGSPDSRIGSSTFSARWTGSVAPLFTETYQFTVRHDDGARLWVNDQLIVNNWTNRSSFFSSPVDTSGSIALVAGQKVSIRLEYFENASNATARLSWSSARQASQVVPTSQLYPAP